MRSDETPILVVSPSAKAGGAERALAGLMRHLPSTGFRPVCALLERGAAEEWLSNANCETIVVCADGTSRSPEVVSTLQQLATSISAGAVLSNKWEGHGFGGAAAVAAGLPATWWQLDVPRFRSDIERVAGLPPASVIACCSKFAAAAQEQISPQARTVTIHPGVAVEQIASRRGSGQRIRAGLGWNRDPIVGIVGRLEDWKGQDTFLHAARLVANSRPDVRFAVVGGALLGAEGSYPDTLAPLAAALDLSDRTYFAGHQPDVYPWFDALDVVVSASVGEPFGLVVVEAMSLSKPVVATVPGGPAEIIEHEKSGLLVHGREPEPMAAAILRVLEEPRLAKELAAGAERRAHDFSERRTAEKFGSVLSGLTQRSADSDYRDAAG